LHPDQHVMVFDPANAKRMWCGHDGGLSYTPDITASSFSPPNSFFPWQDKNNRYLTTQFYTVTIPDDAGDNRIMGGTQDNGTPFFTWNGSVTGTSSDISSGDGGHVYFGEDYAYSASQNGSILRLDYYANNWPGAGWSEITPEDAESQRFLTPWVVDHNNEDIMYYAAGADLWRNDQLTTLPDNHDRSIGITQGWTQLTDLAAPTGHTITAMAVSKTNPTHTLYYAAYSAGQTPKLYRLYYANTATSNATDISITSAPSGAYIHAIALNPDDGRELLVVMSNYNIIGLYHSTNAGQSFTAVEGNLEGNAMNPGPSLRSATILPTSLGRVYLVGTSTGLYSTTQLNGSSTVWSQEAASAMGNVVVEAVASRKSDGRVAAGTHGRGVWIGELDLTGVEDDPSLSALPTAFTLEQNVPNPFNPTTSISYTLPASHHVVLKVYDARGREAALLVDKTQAAGRHTVTFNAVNLPSGVYTARIQAGTFTETKKLTLMK